MKILSDKNIKNALYVNSPYILGTLNDDKYRNHVDIIIESEIIKELINELVILRVKSYKENIEIYRRKVG